MQKDFKIRTNQAIIGKMFFHEIKPKVSSVNVAPPHPKEWISTLYMSY